MSGADSHVLLRAFSDELARSGLRHACTSPGSRSAPLVLALTREQRIRCWSHVDERCAGFFALGVAKATGAPVAVACTSGTAAAELAPAVHEAREARVPLIVLTADRPPELRGVGAGQTIDQIDLYGSAAKWFFEVGAHDATPERLRWIRTLACRAYATALEGRPGVVHLNFPLREPLVPDGPLPADDSGRPDGRPWVGAGDERPGLPDAEVDALAELILAGRRGVVVAGRDERGDGSIAARLAEAAGFPLLADPLSGARQGGAAVAHYDALLRDERFAGEQAPDLVIRLGDLPTSKPLRQWLARLDAPQVALDPEGAWQDPDGVVGVRLAAGDPDLARVHERLTGRAPDGEWLRRWREADARAAAAIAEALGDELSEPLAAATLGEILPADATLVVASSMPVRDVETFFPVREDAPDVLSNRGANGIDGTVSTAFGVAAATAGPVVLLTGDVALAHDIGGLLAASRLGLKLTIVLLNNDGGGIFHFLPVAEAADAFEEHVATPHGLDFAKAADLYGLAHVRVDSPAALRAGLARALAAPEPAIVEVRTERDANVVLHRRLWDAVSGSLR